MCAKLYCGGNSIVHSGTVLAEATRCIAAAVSKLPYINFRIDSLTLAYKFMMNQAFAVEKGDQHRLNPGFCQQGKQ